MGFSLSRTAARDLFPASITGTAGSTAVSGTFLPTATVSFRVNGGAVQTAVADGSGNWSATLGTALAAGDVLALLIGGVAYRTLTIPIPPLPPLDLSAWNVSVPLDANGDGKPDDLLTSVSALPFFAAGPIVKFRFDPVNDTITTPGSKYARSELREQDGSGNNISWDPSDGTHVLAWSVAVKSLPTKSGGNGVGRTVVGQAHGPADEVFKVYYDGGVTTDQVYVFDDKADDGAGGFTPTKFLLRGPGGEVPNIPLDARIDLEARIEDVGDKQTVTVRATYGGVTYSVSWPLSAFWRGQFSGAQPCYFKAGVYGQAGAPGSGAGVIATGGIVEAWLYAIAKNHAAGPAKPANTEFLTINNGAEWLKSAGERMYVGV